jgi:hypothetical protein
MATFARDNGTTKGSFESSYDDLYDTMDHMYHELNRIAKLGGEAGEIALQVMKQAEADHDMLWID